MDIKNVIEVNENSKNIIEVNKVYVTNDYSLFKHMEGNRNISTLHLARLMKSFEKKQLPIPVIVNDQFEVFEGQHRMETCRALHLPVYFMMIENLKLEDAIIVNTVQKKWTAEDYFQHYCTLGKEQYLLLSNFMEITGLTLHNARTFLEINGATGVRQQAKFSAGEFIVQDYTRSLELFNQHLDFKNCPAFGKSSCKLAILKILTHRDYDHSRMMLKLETLSYRVTQRATVTDYLFLFSEIYNYNASKDKKVYFHLDY